MPQTVRITDEDYEILKLIKNKGNWTFQYTLSKAINFFAKVKRLTPWDKLPKSQQDSLKQKAKDLVKGQGRGKE